MNRVFIRNLENIITYETMYISQPFKIRTFQSLKPFRNLKKKKKILNMLYKIGLKYYFKLQ